MLAAALLTLAFPQTSVAWEFELQIRKLRRPEPVLIIPVPVVPAKGTVTILRDKDSDTVGMARMFASRELAMALAVRGWGFEVLDYRDEAGRNLIEEVRKSRNRRVLRVVLPLGALVDSEGKLLATFTLPRSEADLAAILDKLEK